MALTDMGWTSTGPNIFRSDWGAAEIIYRRMSLLFQHAKREHWQIHCVCRVSVGNQVDVTSHLRKAWRSLVIESPGLSVVPDGLAGKVFEVLDEDVIGRWIEETFFVKTACTADHVISTSEPRNLPSLYWLPSSSEVVFLSSHWRTDGVGCRMLLDRLFNLVAQSMEGGLHTKPNRGTQLQLSRISPSLEDAAGCTLGTSEAETAKLREYARTFIDHFHSKAIHSGGMPYRGDLNTSPRNTTHVDFGLTEKSTMALLYACKKRSISVSAAIHAALAQTFFSFVSEDDKRDYTTVMAVNLRKYLQSPYDGSSASNACQTYVASIIPTVRRADDFSTQALELTRHYRSWYSEDFMRALRWIYKIHADRLFNKTPNPAVSGEGEGGKKSEAAPRPPPPSGVTLSSLGVVEQYLERSFGSENTAVQVDAFRFGVTMMTRQMLLYVWTFRDRMTLSLNYNEAYYAKEMADDILARIKRTLEREMTVGLHADS